MKEPFRISNKFNFVLLIFLGLLCWETYSLDKRIKMQMSMYVQQEQHINDMHMMMVGFIDTAPEEMERIARKTGRQESIKVLQEFSDNFKKLNEQSIRTTEN